MIDFESFQFAFKVILNHFAPLKQKLVRNNNQPFMTKTPRKEVVCVTIGNPAFLLFLHLTGAHFRGEL